MGSTIDLIRLMQQQQPQDLQPQGPQMTQEELERAFAQRQAANRQEMGLPDGGWSQQPQQQEFRPALPPTFQGAPTMQEIQGAAFQPPAIPTHAALRGQGEQRSIDLQSFINRMRGQR